MTGYLKTRKIFNPTKTSSDIFSDVSPMLEPRDLEIIEMKKTNLSKTFGPNMWRPASRQVSMTRTMGTMGHFSKTTEVFSSTSHR